MITAMPVLMACMRPWSFKTRLAKNGITKPARASTSIAEYWPASRLLKNCLPQRQRPSEHEQHIADDRAGERGFDDGDQPIPQCKNTDNQFGRVAEGRIQQAPGSRANIVLQILGSATNQRGKRDQTQS